jgi:CMP-2-keto-3-deoxyoctulosonic acid synthetase
MEFEKASNREPVEQLRALYHGKHLEKKGLITEVTR